jgi:hypothetical protein
LTPARTQNEDSPDVLDASMLSHALLFYVLGAAEAMLVRARDARQSHGDVAAAWAPSRDVRAAAERLLGVPAWRQLSQPLLRACLVRVPTRRPSCAWTLLLLLR